MEWIGRRGTACALGEINGAGGDVFVSFASSALDGIGEGEGTLTAEAAEPAGTLLDEPLKNLDAEDIKLENEFFFFRGFCRFD
jgi:hypothetical protein